MEPTLAVIGLNFRTSPVAIRERFCISEARRFEALHHLVRSEGVEEVIVLASCNRTEFILWASDAPSAANSVLRFLTQKCQLKLREWSHFYRLMDEAALIHVLRVTCGLDSMVLGESEITANVKKAWEQAQTAGTTGRFLDEVMAKALTISDRIHTETNINSAAVYVPSAVVELSQEVLGDLAGREVLLIGTGCMSKLSAYCLQKADAFPIKLIGRRFDRSKELARKISATPVSWDDRFRHFKTADIVISSTACPEFILGRQELELVMAERHGKPLLMIDVAVPRDIDPAVRAVKGIHLFDMDDLERIIRRNAAQYQTATEEAEKIVTAEAAAFRGRLNSDRNAPVLMALRQRIDALCREELAVLREELGPFTEDQDQALSTLTAHITQRITGSLVRELRRIPDVHEQEALNAAMDQIPCPSGQPTTAGNEN